MLDEALTNTDFYLTEGDFTESLYSTKNTTMQRRTHTTTWLAIYNIKGVFVVETRNTKGSSCIWAVIENTEEDIFEKLRRRP